MKTKEYVNPLTGEMVTSNDLYGMVATAAGLSHELDEVMTAIVESDDTDALIDLFEVVKDLGGIQYAAKVEIARRLEAKTDSEAKTRRVVGKRRKCKIEMPSETWDNSILKEAWNSYPELAASYLRIDKVAVQAREVKKLAETSSDQKTFCQFRQMVLAAKKPATGMPTVTVEK